MTEVRPWDLFKKTTQYVSEEIQAERYSICKQCQFFIKATKQCSKCGCFMKLKTTITSASCPIQKWNAIAEGYINR
jgi:hypothetical protein